MGVNQNQKQLTNDGSSRWVASMSSWWPLGQMRLLLVSLDCSLSFISVLQSRLFQTFLPYRSCFTRTECVAILHLVLKISYSFAVVEVKVSQRTDTVTE